jgi:arsenate reductase
MAESILNKLGAGAFQAFSAGSHPTRRINALTLDELRRRGYPTAGLASKSWLEFASSHSPDLHFVISVCEKAAAEKQPKWNGNPQRIKWAFPPPGQFTGSDEQIRAAFSQVCGEIEATARQFVGRELMAGDALHSGAIDPACAATRSLA